MNKAIKSTVLTLGLYLSSVKKVGAQVFGSIDEARIPGVQRYSGGLSAFITNVLRLLIVVAGIYAVFNFIIAGYGFMSAGGDPKKIADAWAKIWQTLIGLLIAAGAFVLAAIFGRLLFGDWGALLQLAVYGPPN